MIRRTGSENGEGTDRNGIEELLAEYFQGLYRGDVERLRDVFHPQAFLVGDIEGRPYFKSLAEYLEIVRSRRSPEAVGEEFRMEITEIEVLNGIAYAKVHCPMLGFDYRDFLSLAKTEERWRIVNKLFTHAGPPRR